MPHITTNHKNLDEAMAILLKEKRELTLPLKKGDLIDAKVLGKERDGIFFDLGLHGIGLVFGEELSRALNSVKKLKKGDIVAAKIVEPENKEGYAELSISEAREEMARKDIQEKKDNGEIVTVVIKNANKGGLLAELGGVTAFLPASQLAAEHYPKIENADPAKLVGELRKLVGETLNVKILDFNPGEEKLVISEKSAREENLKEVLRNYHIGDIVEGEITGVVDFGAFMKFDKKNIEGLIHISELDWQLVEKPGDVVKTGQIVKAKIIDIRNGKISFSLKALKKNPWDGMDKKYKKGDVVKAKVIKFNPYGAFAEIDKNIVGLVHISEFGSQKKMEESLEMDKKYDFKIELVDTKKHKIALSLFSG